MTDALQTLSMRSATAANSFILSLFFFFNDTTTTEIYTLSLHDALPISALVVNAGPVYSAWRRPVICCQDRKSTRLNSSHVSISYAVFCLKKKKNQARQQLTVHARTDSAVHDAL